MSNASREVQLHIKTVFSITDSSTSAFLFYGQNIILVILAFYCLTSNSIFLFLQRRLKVLPQNIKKFMIILTFSVILQCVYIIGHCLYNFVYASGLTVFESQDYLVKERWLCALVQCFNISCIATINTAALAVAVELTVTTYLDTNHKNGQDWSESHMITYVSALLVWCTNLYPCTEMFVHPITEVAHQYCYFTLIIDIKYSIPVSIFLIVVELVALGLFAYSYTENRERSTLSTRIVKGHHHSLDQRFKVQQNLNLSKSFLIWSSFQSCTYVASVMLRLVSSIFHDQVTLLNTVIIICFNFQFYILFNLFNPYLQIKNNKMMRRQLFNYLNGKNGNQLSKVSRFLLTWSAGSMTKVGESTGISEDLAMRSGNIVAINPKVKEADHDGPINYRLNPNRMTDVLENFWNVDTNVQKKRNNIVNFGIKKKQTWQQKTDGDHDTRILLK